MNFILFSSHPSKIGTLIHCAMSVDYKSNDTMTFHFIFVGAIFLKGYMGILLQNCV
jgi:hypothetical protein